MNSHVLCSSQCPHDKVRHTEATLIFRRDEILYDCKNLAYVSGDVLDDVNDHVRHQIQDIGESGNVDYVDRLLGLGVSECREMLSPLSKKNPEAVTFMDNIPERSDGWVIELELPEGFSQTTLTLLKHKIHVYLTYYVMWHWLGVTNATNHSQVAYWRDQAELTEKEIIKLKHHHRGAFTRKLNPW